MISENESLKKKKKELYQFIWTAFQLTDINNSCITSFLSRFCDEPFTTSDTHGGIRIRTTQILSLMPHSSWATWANFQKNF